MSAKQLFEKIETAVNITDCVGAVASSRHSVLAHY